MSIQGYADTSENRRSANPKSAQQELIEFLQENIKSLQKQLELYKNTESSIVEVHDVKGRLALRLENAGINIRMNDNNKVEVFIFERNS